jgi:hypothetical protein
LAEIHKTRTGDRACTEATGFHPFFGRQLDWFFQSLEAWMIYILVVSAVCALMYGEASYARNPGTALFAGLLAFCGVFVSLFVPPRLCRYTLQMAASSVLTQLMRRAVLGSGILLVTGLFVWLNTGREGDPAILGELYTFTALGIFVFQGLGETLTRHVMYLQRTDQYNSNQLVAVLLTVTLLLFVLVLYFLAFDLARPPQFHAYVRDLMAITLLLIGYGRSVYMMAHH